MEEQYNLTRVGVDAGQVRPLVKVAVVTRPGEVVLLIAAAVLAGDDVLEVECVEGIFVFVHAAILAPVLCTFTNEVPYRPLHQAALCPANSLRALAWITAIRFPAIT